MTLRRTLAVAAMSLVSVAGAIVAQPASAVSTLFIDNFTGTKGAKPDAGKWSEWSSCTYNGSAGYGKIGCGERATLDGSGHLSIPATPNQGTSISTKDHSRFTTGLFEARMYVPRDAGYWPAFWTLNNNPNGTDRSVIGEVDAHESYTGLANYYHRAVHNYFSPTPTKNWSGADDPACGTDHVFGEWHTYGAKIEANQVTFYFDGVQCGAPVLRSEQASKPWAFAPDNSFGNWMILTYAVGGAGGQQDGKAVVNSNLLVDWVKVTR